MPLYEYECTACHRRTEKILKFSDPDLTICPHCGGPLERTLTAPNVQFKGGGWYKDLYSSAKPASSGESSSDSTPSTDAKPAASDAKPSESKSSGDGSSASNSSAAPSSSPSPAPAPSAPAAAAKP
ncbi:MAG: zinc ribbon domain-containing protein [Acidobacteria bacterium]|nr:zinc ribbon domain-containing protein [Acidobacteriota bacterium]